MYFVVSHFPLVYALENRWFSVKGKINFFMRLTGPFLFSVSHPYLFAAGSAFLQSRERRTVLFAAKTYGTQQKRAHDKSRQSVYVGGRTPCFAFLKPKAARKNRDNFSLAEWNRTAINRWVWLCPSGVFSSKPFCRLRFSYAFWSRVLSFSEASWADMF